MLPLLTVPRTARVLGWLGIAALALGTWRAFPREVSTAPDEPALCAVVIDASAWTSRRRRGYGVWARRTLHDLALSARERGEELEVVLYGSDVRRLRGGGEAEGWLARLEGEGGRTLSLRLEGDGARGRELDAGVALVEEALLDPARRAARLVLVGEAGYTGPDPAPRLARLERGGVLVERRPAPPPTSSDVALVGLAVPAAPETGAPLVARLDLALDPAEEGLAALRAGATLAVRLVVDTAQGSETLEVPLPLPTGPADPDGVCRWSVRVGLGTARAGRGHVTARLRLTGAGGRPAGDPIPEDDLRSASWRSGERRVLAAVGRAESLPALRAWLGGGEARWPGLQWLFVEPERLGGVAGEVDAVLTLDLSPRELPAAPLRALLERGGGWLFCGGWGLLAPWPSSRHPPGETDLAELLPLRPLDPETPERDVLFVVDGSGSMEGDPFERVKQALGELVAIVSESDSLALHFFTGSLGRRIDLDARGGRGREVLHRLLVTRVPGGPTAILYSLERLVELRAESERPALVILLSDGHDHNAFDVERRGEAIRSALAGMGVRLRVLAAGEDADVGLLSALLAPGEQLVHAEDLSGLTDLFRREVLGDRVRHGGFEVRVAPTGELEPSGELLDAWRRGGTAPPPVEGYLRCEARPGADVLWRSSADGEPLLALGRAGTGLVAAWPTSPFPGWAPAFERAGDTLLLPLLRSLARGARRGSATRLRTVGDRLVLEGVPEGWPARIEARLLAYVPGSPEVRELLEEDLARTELLPPSLPAGLDPRRVRCGSLPAALDRLLPGSPLRARLVDGSGAVLADLPLEVPPPAGLTPDGACLRPGPWAAPGDGVPARSAAARRRTDPHAWRWLLGGVLALLAGAILSSWRDSDPSLGAGAS